MIVEGQQVGSGLAGDELGELALVKLGLLDDEDLLDMVGMREQDALLEADGKSDDVAELARIFLHGSERIAAHLEGDADEGQAGGTGRQTMVGGGHLCE